MLRQLISLLLVCAAVTLVGCAKQNQGGVALSGCCEFEPSLLGSIEWALLPGGDISSIDQGNRFYINLDIKNHGPDTVDVSSAIASICSERSVLNIQIAAKGVEKLEKGQSLPICVDLDGYAPYLDKSGGPRAKPLEMFVELPERAFLTTLPEMSEIVESKEKSVAVSFSPTTRKPSLSGMSAIKKDEWPTVPGLLQPPALVRKQGNEMAIYFFYTKK